MHSLVMPSFLQVCLFKSDAAKVNTKGQKVLFLRNLKVWLVHGNCNNYLKKTQKEWAKLCADAYIAFILHCINLLVT